MTPSKPWREFLIIEPSDSDIHEGKFTQDAYEKCVFPEVAWERKCKQHIHVIEHAAYETVKQDLADLAQRHFDKCEAAQKEIDALRDHAKELNEAAASRWNYIFEQDTKIKQLTTELNSAREEIRKRDMADKVRDKCDAAEFAQLRGELQEAKAEIERLKVLAQQTEDDRAASTESYRNWVVGLESKIKTATRSLERCAALCYSWVIAERTADCKHTYTEIAQVATSAVNELKLTPPEQKE